MEGVTGNDWKKKLMADRGIMLTKSADSGYSNLRERMRRGDT